MAAGSFCRNDCSNAEQHGGHLSVGGGLGSPGYSGVPRLSTPILCFELIQNG